jgi:hypothetical protein
MMAIKSNNIDVLLLKTLGHFTYVYPVFLLMYAIVLFDSLEIIVYKQGIIDTDFSHFFELSKIPFFLLFLVLFDIISAILSPCLELVVFKSITYCTPLKLKELFKTDQKKDPNFIKFDVLYGIALKTENIFLMKYLDKERKNINTREKNCHMMYSLLAAIIINLVATFAQEKDTIVTFISSLYLHNDCFPIKIFAWILLIPVVLFMASGIYFLLTEKHKEIYYPEDAYKKLLEEK